MKYKIVISGISGDLGQAIAQSLQNNYEVIGLYHKNKPTGLQNVKLFHVNFEEPETYQKLLSDLSGNLIYIHGAALSRDSLLIHENSLNARASIEVNLISAIEISKCLLPNMLKQNFGKFIFLSSVVASRPQIGTASYSISKIGLDSLCKSISVEYGNFGVTANVLQLGYFNVGLGARLNDKKKKDLLKRIPLKRFGEVKEIINTLNFILDNNYLSGSVLTLDGGFQVT